jgi:hypothetical protein
MTTSNSTRVNPQRRVVIDVLIAALHAKEKEMVCRMINRFITQRKEIPALSNNCL